MKVLFAGGGTGGHLYPAVAMAGELKKLVADAEISFAGTSGGIESTEVPRLGFKLHLIPVRGLKRGWSLADIIANVGVLADHCIPDIGKLHNSRFQFIRVKLILISAFIGFHAC